MLMSQIRKSFPAFLIAILAALTLWSMRSSDRLDHAFSDVLLAQEPRSVSDRYVVIELTQQDLVRLDNVSRQHGALADVLDQARLGGAQRVLIDFGLGGDLVRDGDRALDRAIASLGPQKVAIAAQSETEKANPSGLY